MRSGEIESRPVALADRAVARILAETTSDETIYPRVLEAIGQTLDWELGLIWEAAPEDGPLTCVDVWYSPAAGDGAAQFAAASLHTVLASGQGLPGQVWASGEASWIVDFASHTEFPRAARAAATGMRSALCSPVRSAGGILGAIEFLSSRTREPDVELLEAMASLGSQIGQVVERRRAESRAQDAGERHRAIVDAALDCIITVDQSGRVLEFNPAAERTFGYSEEDAIGRDMGELIVPPALRERHRQGFARCVREGQGRLVGTRIELTGMREDGTQFPVELTITQIDVPGAPRFTGFVRDITERHEAEAELKASRTRIVEAGDEARRRIERDLHDGAQQRLIALAANLGLTKATMGDVPEATRLAIEQAHEQSLAALADLRALVRGLYPAVLGHRGLDAALSGLVAHATLPVRLRVDVAPRCAPGIEAIAYFTVSEALANIAKHAGAGHAEVTLRRSGQRLLVTITDDGRGGASMDSDGSGLRGLDQRARAVDGWLRVDSPAGGPTTITMELPCAS
ncbi:MAG TPA: PAS domain S-box protein [Thermoleophilaceae bacterium]